MEVQTWNNVKVAVQSVIATAKTITAITKANPAVATSVAHGYTLGDIVLLNVKGMRKLDWRVVRVGAVTADTFALEGIDSTTYPDFVSGTAAEITFGTEAETLQEPSPSGGEAEDIQIRTIHDDQDISIPGNRSAISYSFTSVWDVSDPFLLALASFDESKTPAAMMIEFSSGMKMYMAAVPSVPMTPAGSTVVTTPVKVSLRGKPTYYAS